MIDTKRLTESLLGTVRAWVEPAFGTVQARLDDLDLRLKSIPAGKDGANGIDGKNGENGINGKDADLSIVDALIEAKVITAFAKLPVPKDGINGQNGKDGAPGTDGRDADPEFIRSEIKQVFAALPIPKDGEPGKDGINGVDGSPGEPGAPGKDGERGLDGESVDTAFLHSHICALVEPIAVQFADMAEEMLRGFEEEMPAPVVAQQAPMSINIDTKDKGKSGSATAREQMVAANLIAKQIRDVLMLPVKPVFDDKGKLLYGQRVAE